MSIGCFMGLGCGSGTDIDDTEVKWVRVRKLGAQPGKSYGPVEDSTD